MAKIKKTEIEDRGVGSVLVIHFLYPKDIARSGAL